jgi:LAO/AO transport system kinase
MDIENLKQELLLGKRRALAKAITLIESRSLNHKAQAKALLESILPHSGNSIRIGISGTPGVGKSTLIESFGMFLINKGYRVAVLAIDPTSHITGGSILGDKTRMEFLSRQEKAFIRPSPSGDSLGGVARKTRESIFLCEANGYDIVIVETVGVGQSEITVASMVDFFTLMQLPNSGDELQGIKRGIMEVANAIIINKADKDNYQKAKLAKKQIENAIGILRPIENGWIPPVLLASAKEKFGIEELWNIIGNYVRIQKENGFFTTKRTTQSKHWMWSVVMDGLKDKLNNNTEISNLVKEMEKAVENKQTTPSLAAEKILSKLFNSN